MKIITFAHSFWSDICANLRGGGSYVQFCLARFAIWQTKLCPLGPIKRPLLLLSTGDNLIHPYSAFLFNPSPPTNIHKGTYTFAII